MKLYSKGVSASMMRPLCIAVVLVVFVGYMLPDEARSQSPTSSSPVPVAGAAQLDRLVAKLLGEGKYREAIAPAERALALREQALGPHHPDVATNLNSLAVLYQDQGVYAKAEPLYVRALAIREHALGTEHPLIAISLTISLYSIGTEAPTPRPSRSMSARCTCSRKR
jgi:tetratricopeptide (TPR) repeat protein